jgi:mannose-6-phosphate isomerase-like protein (cupin superfamily)
MTSPMMIPQLAGQVMGSAENSFVIAEWRDAGVPQGSSPAERRLIAPLHVHHADDEAWYVLEGRLGVQMGEREVETGSGGAVLVPRGTPHTYWNAGSEQLRYLLIMTPKIYQLINGIHAATDRSAESMRALFAKFDSELLGM